MKDAKNSIIDSSPNEYRIFFSILKLSVVLLILVLALPWIRRNFKCILISNRCHSHSHTPLIKRKIFLMTNFFLHFSLATKKCGTFQCHTSISMIRMNHKWEFFLIRNFSFKKKIIVKEKF